MDNAIWYDKLADAVLGDGHQNGSGFVVEASVDYGVGLGVRIDVKAVARRIRCCRAWIDEFAFDPTPESNDGWRMIGK